MNMFVYTFEQRWEILRNYFENFWQKTSFQVKLILILAGMSTRKIVAFGSQKTRTHTLKSHHAQNESLCGADLGPEA